MTARRDVKKRFEIELNEKTVTLSITCVDHYEAMMLYDRMIEEAKAGVLSLTMEMARKPEGT